MKSTLLLYLLSIIVALGFGLVSIWDVSVPMEGKSTETLILTPVMRITSGAGGLNLAGVSAGKLWNIKNEMLHNADTKINSGNSSWEISLEKDVWVLTKNNDRDNSWLFQGVLLDNGSYGAIFYNKNTLPKWTVVREHKSFHGLDVLKISDNELVLQDGTKKKFHLGLFYLKRDNGQEMKQ